MEEDGSGGEFESSKLYQEINTTSGKTWKRVLDLLAGGADVRLKGVKNRTYLHAVALASGGGTSETVDRLLPVIYQLSQEGLDVSSIDDDGNTALHLCLQVKAPRRIVLAMLQIGVDPTVRNYDRKEALELIDPQDQLLQGLLQFAVPGLGHAIRAGDVPQAKALMDMQFSTDVIAESVPEGSALIELMDAKLPTIRLVQTALAGKGDHVTQLFQTNVSNLNPNVFVESNAASVTVDGEVLFWPLLAEVIRLGLFEVAKALLANGADVNIPLVDKDAGKVALFQWAFKNLAKDSPNNSVEVLKLVVSNADGTILKNSADFMHYIWKDHEEFFDELLDRGASLSVRNKDGYTVRDLIMTDVIRHGIVLLRTGLLFVDEYISRMAFESQQLERMEMLALDGYEYINVENKEGESLMQVARERNKQDVVDCLTKISGIQKDGRLLHLAIELGNMVDAKQYMQDDRLMSMRDRAGRQPLHKAVAFERVFIAGHIVRQFPSTVNGQDFRNRTPLHYAYSIPGSEGEEMVELLLSVGADPNMPDDNGWIPSDYAKLQSTDFIEKERTNRYGRDVYLIDRYVRFVDAIKTGSLDRVQELCTTLWDISINDVDRARASLSKSYRPLLMHCVDNMCEDLAIFLIQNGADYKLSDGNSEPKSFALLQAAQKRELKKLVEHIRILMKEGNQQRELEEAYRLAFTSTELESAWSRAGAGTDMSGELQIDGLEGDESDDRLVSPMSDQNQFPNNNNDDNPQKQTSPSSSCILL